MTLDLIKIKASEARPAPINSQITTSGLGIRKYSDDQTLQ